MPARLSQSSEVMVAGGRGEGISGTEMMARLMTIVMSDALGAGSQSQRAESGEPQLLWSAETDWLLT